TLANGAASGLVTYSASSGPLPLPETFAGYEQVLPGAADRILTMAEQAQVAEISHDRTVTRAYAAAYLMTACVPIGMILLAAVCAVTGLTAGAWVAGILGAIGIVPQVAITIHDSFNRSKDRTGNHRS
ncbi:MAG: DUF2335 domain-containing protein, partial [Bifidobacteriaceae bacterium]|nr:DUF2335 domain-containing protein [Bifidobacteriaceae bacterium]